MVGASFVLQPHSTSSEYLANLRNQLTEAGSHLAQLQQQADNLHGQINSLQQQISASQSRVSTLQAEIQGLQNQLSSVTSEIASLHQQLDNVQSQLTSTQASLNTAQQERDQIQSSLQDATAKVDQLSSALQQQQATLQTYTANRDQAQQTHDSLLAQYNTRVQAYNDRANTYNQKMQDYNTRWSKLKKEIIDLMGVGIVGVALVGLATYITGGFDLGDVPAIISILSSLGINMDVGGMMNEYNELSQLKSWLQSEQAWLQSESTQLQSLNAQLDQATNDLAHWNDMVQNQQVTIAKTQSDLDYWTSQKNQLTSQLNDAQTKVDQLTTELKNLQSQQTQLQSSVDIDSAKQQQLNSSIESDQSELGKQQELITSLNSDKSSAETTLHNCDANTQKTKSEIDAVSYEINLIVVHPFLEWGGLAIFAVAIAALIVTTFGIATLVSGVRAGIGTVRGLPRRLRRTGPIPETGPSIVTAEMTEEAPAVQRAEEVPAEVVEVHAKPAPEVTVIPIAPAKTKMTLPRKRKVAAAKPTKKERAGRKRRTREKIAKSES
jgi:predicted  nucleic acid-binding Zn-ribbon protein